MVESKLVELVVAGSSPVGHPTPLYQLYMKTKTNRLTTLVLAAAVLSLLPSIAVAQLPADLASRKDFSARAGFEHRPQRDDNGDSRAIDPGQTLTLMDVKGSGRVTHIWFTINSPSPEHLRELVLRMTWDDATRPAVECPVGDFFAQGHAQICRVPKRGRGGRLSQCLNCYWPMPFKKHAVITVSNEGDRPGEQFLF